MANSPFDKISPETRFTTPQLAVALTELGLPTGKKTLDRKACVGGGPPYQIYERRRIYLWADVVVWILAELGPAASNASEHRFSRRAQRARMLAEITQTALAAPECDADGRHYAEQERIIAKLRTLVPQDYYELAALFKFALAEIEVGGSLRCDGADFEMLSNIHGALFDVLSQERETVLQKGMENMREFLNKRTGAAFDVARDPETIKRIGWGRA